MYIKLLIRILLGYVRVEVEGYYIERFINICANRKILIWNLKRDKNVKLTFNIGIKDFKELTKISKKTNCKIKILNKNGIPFILHKYRKRKVFIVFLIIIVTLIYISTQYIWSIEIIVEDNFELENIEEDIENAGLTKGMKKKNIDTSYIINNIMLSRDDIAWIGIEIKGTHVIIDIVKAETLSAIIKNTSECKKFK